MPRRRSLPWFACSAARPRKRSPGSGKSRCAFHPQIPRGLCGVWRISFRTPRVPSRSCPGAHAPIGNDYIKRLPVELVQRRFPDSATLTK